MELAEKLKKLRIQKKLTQEEVAKAIGISRQAYNAYEQNGARPRKKETYIKLAKLLECDVEYLQREDGFATLPMLGTLMGAMPIVGPAFTLATITAMKIAEKEKKKNDRLDAINCEQENKEEVVSITTAKLSAYNKQLHSFSVIASGLLYGRMAQNGIRFRPGSAKELDFQWYDEDPVIYLEDGDVDTWLFKCIAVSEEDRSLDKFVRHMAISAILNLVLLPLDAKRKVSIVVNDKELFQELLAYKNCNSYRGNLSIILLDTNEIRIVKEEYIATYDSIDSTTLIKL